MPLADPPIRLEVLEAGSAEAGPLTGLLEEAARQLDVCNACRYCEGFCAVFPALERRASVDFGDVSQLANLCHDCRACFDACMYSSPHEFDINVPKALTAVRLSDYQRYVWPRHVPRLFSGARGMLAGALVSAAVVLTIALIHVGSSGLTQHVGGAASPYRLIPDPALLTLMFVATAYAVGVAVAAGASYWREIGGAPDTLRCRAVGEAVWYALTLRYLRGGGEECYYPDDERPSLGRRYLHGFVVGGFGLCLLATVAAAIEQDIVGTAPPYPWLSVPVLSGAIGGVALVLGCAGLTVLKTRASEVTSLADMSIKDYGLLCALQFLALSGIAVLLTRRTPAYGIVLLVHLAALVEAFAMAPYSKFVHIVFRLLALVRDNLERIAAAS